MKFEKLEQFIEASFINKAKWLREAEVEDLATVMPKHPEFAIAVRETIGQEGIQALDDAKLLDYEGSLKRLTRL
jgi:hypothetical protein